MSGDLKSICPGCGSDAHTRISRQAWMRMLPNTRHCQCRQCDATYAVLVGGIVLQTGKSRIQKETSDKPEDLLADLDAAQRDYAEMKRRYREAEDRFVRREAEFMAQIADLTQQLEACRRAPAESPSPDPAGRPSGRTEDLVREIRQREEEILGRVAALKARIEAGEKSLDNALTDVASTSGETGV